MKTRLTEFFGIDHPIISAPMAFVSGGKLAAAVTSAGGLGLIGGGYGDSDWLEREFGLADGARVGCGFITWSLARKPELLDATLERQPATVMLSFGELQPFAERIHAAGIPLMAQVQTLEQARQALDAGPQIVVAQGGEAGGHGMTVRSTFTLVPDVVDLAAERAPETLVLAAGGVADGRGLAAALMLGADGVVVGTRFWASAEALVSPRAHERAIGASGDSTYRTRVYDYCAAAGLATRIHREGVEQSVRRRLARQRSRIGRRAARCGEHLRSGGRCRGFRGRGHSHRRVDRTDPRGTSRCRHRAPTWRRKPAESCTDRPDLD